MMGELRDMDLFNSFFNGTFLQRTEYVLLDLLSSCKGEGVKRTSEEELIDLFVPYDDNSNKKKRTRGLMITDKELRLRGSQRVIPEHVRAKNEELGGVKPVLVITKFTDLTKQHVRQFDFC